MVFFFFFKLSNTVARTCQPQSLCIPYANLVLFWQSVVWCQDSVPFTKSKLSSLVSKPVRTAKRDNHRFLFSLKLSDYKHFSYLCMVHVMQNILIGAYKTMRWRGAKGASSRRNTLNKVWASSLCHCYMWESDHCLFKNYLCRKLLLSPLQP